MGNTLFKSVLLVSSFLLVAPFVSSQAQAAEMYGFKGLLLNTSHIQTNKNIEILSFNPSAPIEEQVVLKASLTSHTAVVSGQKETEGLNLYFDNSSSFTPFIATSFSHGGLMGSRLGFDTTTSAGESYESSLATGLRYQVDDGMYIDTRYNYKTHEDSEVIDNRNGHEIRFGFTWDLN